MLIWDEVYEENGGSESYVIGKGESILLTFSDNYAYSPLMLYQDSTAHLWAMRVEKENDILVLL